jgi:death-on-curing protein
VIRWVTTTVVLAIHDEQIAEHGGSAGVRDLNALESALARPKNQLAYGEPDLAALAAAYAFGIATNHAFVDGNKRTSAVVTEMFLALNGAELTASDAEIVQIWSDLGAGSLSEAALADWIRERIAKKQRRRSRRNVRVSALGRK